MAKPGVICARFTEPDEWAAEIVREGDMIARVTKTARPVTNGRPCARGRQRNR